MGYHLREIAKGKFGEFSKVQEEIEELQDAAAQEDKVLILCELTDLLGAIEGYVNEKYNLTLMDLIKFSRKTQDAFIEGKRK